MKVTAQGILAALLVATLVVFGSGASVSVEGPDGDTTVVEVSPPPADTPGGEAVNANFDYLFGILGQLPNAISATALAGFVAALYNVAKLTGFLKFVDGKSREVVIALSATALAVVTAANYFGYGDKTRELLEGLGPALAALTTLGAVIVGPNVTHNLMSRFAPGMFSISTIAKRKGLPKGGGPVAVG